MFAGVGRPAPANIERASFESTFDFPRCIAERMIAADGTEVTLALAEFGPPQAYVGDVSERVHEAGVFAVPKRFNLVINGRVPVGSLEVGPLKAAPPVGADLQNVRFDPTRR